MKENDKRSHCVFVGKFELETICDAIAALEDKSADLSGHVPELLKIIGKLKDLGKLSEQEIVNENSKSREPERYTCCNLSDKLVS